MKANHAYDVVDRFGITELDDVTFILDAYEALRDTLGHMILFLDLTVMVDVNLKGC